MTKYKIFHSVNSGLCFYNDYKSIMIDFLHGGKEVGFSKFPTSLYENMLNKEGLFSRETSLFFTHTHKDHYDVMLLNEFEKLYPISFQTVTTLKTVHEGKQFKDVNHQSIILTLDDNHYFVSGDALLDEQTAINTKELISSTDLEAIFVNPYQLISQAFKAFRKQLNIKNIYLYHLPFAEDDCYNAINLANNAIKFNQNLNIKILKNMEDIQI
ncbi:hypothetical protein AN396_02560 [Candidatus Epulonipiscium fishelsonii]|uniref:Uncharacterized protein n=1 Tax=Candidatus Epulonipiscium fishelsonii TaxID=77094 RepID=A0ACC8XF42_9FIRM|nr:hypothetical protein AN396_02560 [Epulopiscium sp. SCG-B11WGA-EpuloA1]